MSSDRWTQEEKESRTRALARTANREREDALSAAATACPDWEVAPKGLINEAIAMLDYCGREDLGSVVKGLWSARQDMGWEQVAKALVESLRECRPGVGRVYVPRGATARRGDALRAFERASLGEGSGEAESQ